MKVNQNILTPEIAEPSVPNWPYPIYSEADGPMRRRVPNPV